jgi:hypothetical protein
VCGDGYHVLACCIAASISKFDMNGPANNVWGNFDKTSISTSLFTAGTE